MFVGISMRLLTREQSKLLDQRATTDYSISSEELMNNAGTSSAKWIHHYLSQNSNCEGLQSKILVLVGPGHNGGDGWVMATQLQKMGYYNIEVFDPLKTIEYSPLYLKKRNEYFGRIVREKHQVNLDVRIIVDAFFGIGLNRPLKNEALSVIHFLNKLVETKNSLNILGTKLNITVVSLDIPSGLDADTGCILGGIIKSNFTLSFGRPKIGLFVNEGPLHSGRILNFSIGLPIDLIKELANTFFLFKSNHLGKFLPKRQISDNKSKLGKALLIAGSQMMPGAASLAAEACARIGAGYTTLSAPELNPLWSANFLRLNLMDLCNDQEKYSAIAMGPGMGFSRLHQKVLQNLMDRDYPQVLLDADALSLLSFPSHKMRGSIKLPKNWLLTPHAGELYRLLKNKYSVTSQEIEQDRFKWVSIAADYFGCWVLLKGFRTVVSNGTKTFVIETGHPALAKSGTGDVLSGMIVGLMAQGLSTPLAALVGSTLHGKLADLWVKSGRDPICLLATDLIHLMPKYIAKIRAKY